MNKTSRGFSIINFTDLYGAKCSLQKSSLATKHAIWLGIDDAEPKILASKAKAYGIDTEETTGWVPYPIPEDVLLSTRMHLDVKQAKKLISRLQKFVDTNEVED